MLKNKANVNLTWVLLACITISAFSGCLSAENQWALSNTQINVLMNDYDGSGITIGIVDTGIDSSHPALSGMKDHIKWKDYINGKSEPYDDNGHGTHVAGILAARSSWYDPLFGRPILDGIAPSASYIIVKAIDRNGTGSDSNVADAINFCANNGADIICLSLGGGTIPILGTSTENAAADAAARGIFVVSAAGNDPQASDVAAPANQQDVIAVGAVNSNCKIADFSQKGDNDGMLPGFQGTTVDQSEREDPNKKPEVVAPGVGITSCWKEGTYAVAQGTSQAVPYVGGAIALVLQARGSVSVSAMKTDLMNTAKKCPGQATPHDDQYGYGLIQAKALLDKLS